MLLSWPFSFYETSFSAALLYGLYYTYWQLTTGASNRRFIAAHGCKPVKVYRSKLPLGLDFVWESYRAMKQHRVLDVMKGMYDRMGGNTAQINIFGRTIISTIEPENLKAVLSTDFQNFHLADGRKKLLTPFLGAGIFVTDGAEWQHSRELLRPNFARSQVGDMEMFEKHVGFLIHKIPRDEATVNLQDLFFTFTLDVATEFLFGESTDCQRPGAANKEAREFVEAFSYAQRALSGQETQGWGFLGLFLPDSKLKKEYKVVHGFVDRLIEKALANREKYECEKEQSASSPNKHYLFLYELFNQTTDKIKIRAELLNILLAGRDTTASLLSNVWFELSKRPTVYAALRAEVDALDGGMPSLEQLKNMKYLRALINESLRLHAIVPENMREAVNDTVLPLGGGPDGKSPVFVPKGRGVHWTIHVMHRRKDLYGEDAEEFKPERWLDGPDGKKGLRVGWEYLPWNGGPRICIGRESSFYLRLELHTLVSSDFGGLANDRVRVEQFALAEASYVTVRLLQEFSKIESRDPEPWRENITMTCTGSGCKVSLTPASN